jgi:hypothetical protein
MSLTDEFVAKGTCRFAGTAGATAAGDAECGSCSEFTLKAEPGALAARKMRRATAAKPARFNEFAALGDSI